MLVMLLVIYYAIIQKERQSESVYGTRNARQRKAAKKNASRKKLKRSVKKKIGQGMLAPLTVSRRNGADK
jgi:hypothetical protein